MVNQDFALYVEQVLKLMKDREKYPTHNELMDLVNFSPNLMFIVGFTGICYVHFKRNNLPWVVAEEIENQTRLGKADAYEQFLEDHSDEVKH